jgi:hypothetical protein
MGVFLGFKSPEYSEKNTFMIIHHQFQINGRALKPPDGYDKKRFTEKVGDCFLRIISAGGLNWFDFPGTSFDRLTSRGNTLIDIQYTESRARGNTRARCKSE